MLGWSRQGTGRHLVVGGLMALLSAVACGRVSDSASPASPSDDPIYYVDGARPSPGVNEASPVPQSEYIKGCVPWSEERPDYFVCAPVEEGFEPAPPPGGYADYPEVCDAAAAVFETHAKGLVDEYALTSVPQVELSTCGAGGLGSKDENRWLVRFGLAEMVGKYSSALIPQLDMDAQTDSTQGLGVIVVLSETPWPL
jgi:hypothetical protein